jgi:hypothetical protein
MKETKRILITVKTYPHPSKKYRELVCVAGVQEDGSFIRLYPVQFRYMNFNEQFAKYQWVELDVEKNWKDPRPESFRPISNSIKLGEKISTEKNWLERKKWVLQKPLSTMCGLNQHFQTEVSLGIIKPREIISFSATRTESDWNEAYKSSLLQKNFLIDQEAEKILEKIPYKFSYRYKCMEENCKGHEMIITDWEIGMLYLRQFQKYKDEEKAIAGVRETFLDKLCGMDKDTHFFVGTVQQHATWIILGVFYPQREPQQLFRFNDL